MNSVSGGTFVRFQPQPALHFGMASNKQYSEKVEKKLADLASDYGRSIQVVKAMYEYANGKQETPSEEKSLDVVNRYLSHYQIYMMTEAVGESGGTYQQFMDQDPFLNKKD